MTTLDQLQQEARERFKKAYYNQLNTVCSDMEFKDERGEWFNTILDSEIKIAVEAVVKKAEFIKKHSQLPNDIKEEHQAGWFLGHFDGLKRLLSTIKGEEK